ncbi:unnamed protein product [Rhizoctonia solani]|uniref:Enoyl reductase (ER) domain-containing protein n=1 Tax=Rhizoctonia solani TaxID=456999 RepID=A0A8H2ZYI8_9AGAM|nr:unnamed protein product [Rhizoctonia solani]
MLFPKQCTRLFLAERPNGPIDDTTFKSETVPLSAPSADQVVVRVEYISMDPGAREWLDERRSYFPSVEIGETMRAVAIGTVAQGNEQLDEGDIVYGILSWAEYVVVPAKDLRKLSPPKGTTVVDFLGPLGFTGMTAYFGLLEVGKIKAGETLVVSGAAGATGSLVCQIGKMKGAKVIALASASKCAYLLDELGVDVALDYKSPTFARDFCAAVGYLDVFFDNVGGEILELALSRLKTHARVVLCGAISTYNRATIQGFINLDYVSRFAEAETEIAKWMNEGKLKFKYHIEEGLEQCPQYFGLLFTGGNNGKLIVKVPNNAT